MFSHSYAEIFKTSSKIIVKVLFFSTQTLPVQFNYVLRITESTKTHVK